MKNSILYILLLPHNDSLSIKEELRNNNLEYCIVDEFIERDLLINDLNRLEKRVSLLRDEISYQYSDIEVKRNNKEYEILSSNREIEVNYNPNFQTKIIYFNKGPPKKMDYETIFLNEKSLNKRNYNVFV